MALGLEPVAALEFKIQCFSRGIRLTPAAEAFLSQGGKVPLSIHEYATTGGVTLRRGDIYVNAPFDRGFPRPDAPLLDHDDGLVVHMEGASFEVEALPLPGYLQARDAAGRPVTDAAMSHADRVRLSPIGGCAYACKFCDIAGKPYVLRPVEQVVAALRAALTDAVLPAEHVLVSGGTPTPRDRDHLLAVCQAVHDACSHDLDLMFTPWGGGEVIDRFVDAGVTGFAINLEVFDARQARLLAPQKWAVGLETYEAAIHRAVERTGDRGSVRSLLVVGLEPMESLLAGVERLARLGCDPVLSPFRPAEGTPLQTAPPPDEAFLREAYERSRDIAAAYGVALGPRCIPCGHNTLTIPEGPSYHRSHRGEA